MTTFTSVPHSRSAYVNTFNPLKNQVFVLISLTDEKSEYESCCITFSNQHNLGKWSCDLNQG